MNMFIIIKRGEEWIFQKKGSPRALRKAKTKKDIVYKMRDYMKNKKGSVKIYKEDGKIQVERKYGS